MIFYELEAQTNNEKLLASTKCRDVDVSELLRSLTSLEARSGKDPPRDASCENEMDDAACLAKYHKQNYPC